MRKNDKESKLIARARLADSFPDPQRRSPADQLLALAARTQDASLRDLLLRQVAQLQALAETRALQARRA